MKSRAFSISILAFLAALPMSSFAFTTSFEQPDYNPGVLDEQGPWLTTGSAWFVGGRPPIPARARTGTQSVEWTNAFGNSSSFADYNFSSRSRIIGSVWINIFEGPISSINISPSTSHRFGLQLVSNASTFPTLMFDGFGNVYGKNTDTSAINLLGNVGPVTNQWVEVVLGADGTTGAVTGSVKGQTFSLFNMGAANDTLSAVTMYHQNLGSSQLSVAHFDDFQAVPEPSSMLALSGAIAVLYWRRKRSKEVSS